MKRNLLILALMLPFVSQAMEYSIQLENEFVRVSKIALEPGEKVGLHRDEFPRAVYPIKGGVITRTEADGSKNEVVFPTGQTVYLPADYGEALHTGENGNTELEIIVVELKNG